MTAPTPPRDAAAEPGEPAANWTRVRPRIRGRRRVMWRGVAKVGTGPRWAVLLSARPTAGARLECFNRDGERVGSVFVDDIDPDGMARLSMW